MSNKTVKDIMHPIHACLTPKMDLIHVSEHLSRYQLPGAPVIDENHMPLGFVSEYDCLEQLMQSSYYCDSTSLVEDVMSTKLITTTPDLKVINVASIMNENKLNVLPVLDNGKIIGVISRASVMRELIKELAECKVPV